MHLYLYLSLCINFFTTAQHVSVKAYTKRQNAIVRINYKGTVRCKKKPNKIKKNTPPMF